MSRSQSVRFQWTPAVGLVLMGLAGGALLPEGPVLHGGETTVFHGLDAPPAADTLAWEIPWFPDPPPPPPPDPTNPDSTGADWLVTIEELPPDSVPPGPTGPGPNGLQWLGPDEAALLFDGPMAGAGGRPAARAGVPAPRASSDPGRGAPGEPLEVLAVIPEGELAEAANLTVVFSTSMVPLGQADAPDPPVDLQPQPDGAWQWLDPRTLRFEPADGRLPGGTRFTLRVPAGTTDASGSRLESDHRTELEIRGPRALGGAPNLGITERQPVIVLQMDQDTDPATLAAAARLEFGGRTMAVEPAELSDVSVRRMRAAERIVDGYPVAIRPIEPLPLETDVTLRLSAGLTSREGPIPTGRAQTLRFRTLGPMRLSNVSCTRADNPCRARSPLRLNFSNPLDPEQPLGDRVRVEPEPDGLQLRVNGQELFVWGDFQPFTSHDVYLDPALVDVFDQELGEAHEAVVHFGGATSFLRLPGAPLVGIPANAPAELEVATRGIGAVELRHYRADPSDWSAFQRLQIGSDRIRVEPPPDSALLAVDTLLIDDGERRAALPTASVGEPLEAAGGHLIVLVREIDPSDPSQDRNEAVSPELRASSSRIVWVQRAPLGVEVVRGHDRALATVTTFEGEPVPDAVLRFDSDSVEVRTGADGLAAVPLPDSVPLSLLVRHRDHLTIVRVGNGLSIFGPAAWSREAGHPRPVWYAMSDRQLYRPGEGIRVQGWIREIRDDGGVRMGLPERTRAVRFRIESTTGIGGTRVLAEGQTGLTAAGGFHLAAELPADTPSGRATVHLEALDRDPDSDPGSGPGEPARAIDGWETRVQLRIQEFRRPEYEMDLEVPERALFPSEAFEAVAVARYFDGPTVPDADIEWRLESGPIWFGPPGWAGWIFGSREPEPPRRVTGVLESRTDRRGRHGVRIVPGTPPVPTAVALTVSAVIRDLDRQGAATQHRLVVHPASVMPGLRVTPGRPAPGDTVEVELAVTDIEGVPTAPADRPTLRILGPDGVPAPACDLRSAELGSPEGRSIPGWRCRTAFQEPGAYQVRAGVHDDRGRASMTDWPILVQDARARPGLASGPSVRPARQLELEVESGDHAPGDTAHIRIRAPFAGGVGLAVHDHHGVQSTVRLALAGSEHELRIPLGSSPGRHTVAVQLAAPGRGRSATGGVVLLVEDPDQELSVELAPPEDRVAPGDTAVVRTRVLDSSGRPVEGAEVAVWLVDEAILSLGGSHPTDALYDALSQAGYSNLFDRHASLFAQLRWPREPPGPGRLSGRILEGASGHPASASVRVIRNEQVTWASAGGDGEFVVDGVPEGPLQLQVIHRGDTIVLGDFEPGPGGLDIGTRFLPVRPRAAPSAGSAGTDPEAALRPTPSRWNPGGVALRMRAVVVGRTVTSPGVPAEPPLLRQDFSPLAGFEPSVITGPDGVGEARFELPHTLTRYRIHALAVHGADRAGGSDTTMVVDQELVVRATPPRFLRSGDEGDITLNVQNAGSRPRTVRVALRSEDLEVLDVHGARFRLPAGGRRVIGIPVRAVGVGPASFEVRAEGGGGAEADGGAEAQVGAEGEGVADALAMTFEVQPPLAYRSMAFREELSGPGGTSVPIRLPPDTRSDAGGLELRVAGSRLGLFEPELRTLVTSPFAWAGLRTGRIRLAAELMDPGPVGDAVPAELVERLEGVALADIHHFGAILVQYAQGNASLEWVGSVITGRAQLQPAVDLVRAVVALEAVGIELPWGLAASLRLRFAQESQRFRARDDLTDLQLDRSRLESLVHLAWALDQTGLADSFPAGSELRRPIGELDGVLEDLTPATLARLAALRSGDPGRELLAVLQSRAVLSGAAVTFRTGRAEVSETGTAGPARSVVPSNPSEDAAVLEALLHARPDHELVAGLVRGLSARSSETRRFADPALAGVLVALSRYARVHEAGVPDAVVRGVVSGRTLLDHRLRSRRADDRSAHMPMSRLAADATDPDGGIETELVLDVEGHGPVHIRALLEWSPADPVQPPEARGFVVRRWFEAVDDEEDVRQESDGSWTIRAGARVRIQTEVMAPASRSDVLLAVPVPAGLEPLNPQLDSPALLFDPDDARGLLSTSHGVGWAGRFGWIRERRVLSDAIEVWAPWLQSGSYRMEAMAVATIPGDFIAPAPMVHEAENPDVFGRGAAVRVRVVDR